MTCVVLPQYNCAFPSVADSSVFSVAQTGSAGILCSRVMEVDKETETNGDCLIIQQVF